MSKEFSFIVTLLVSDHLVDRVVENYVDMAIKKYDKLANRHTSHPGYFSGLESPPFCAVTRIDLSGAGDLRDAVLRVLKVTDSVDRHFKKIDGLKETHETT